MWSSTGCCYLLLSFTLINAKTNMTEIEQQEFNPNIVGSKNLVCYQCKSISTNITPECDTNFFKLTRPNQRNKMLFVCPSYQKTFCFKKVHTYAYYVETLRGCTNHTDKKGHKMKSGCITSVEEGRTVQFCLCNKNKCNIGSKPSSILNVVIVFPLVLFVNKIILR